MIENLLHRAIWEVEQESNFFADWRLLSESKYPFWGRVIIRISLDFLIAGSFLLAQIEIYHLTSPLALTAERLLAHFFGAKIENYNQKSKIEN